MLIHVEVQGESEDDFAERMYTYQYRLRDLYAMDVVSLAVLADTGQTFRPTSFHYQRWGCELSFSFPMAKLIDWEERWEELEASSNVFSLVVMAQVQAKRIKDGATRKESKIALIRLLYERGYSREQVVELFVIIDWMMQLPSGLEVEFVEAVYAMQEEKKMPYVNTIERVEREKERQFGRQEERSSTLLYFMERRFGVEAKEAYRERVEGATLDELEVWFDRAIDAERAEEIFLDH